jgi:hypothetical protein
MGFAMAGVPTLLSTEKFAFSFNWGTFQGENGGALSGAVRIYRNVQLQGSFAYGFREKHGWRACRPALRILRMAPPKAATSKSR